MIRRLPLCVLLFPTALALSACGDDETASAPDGVSCGSTQSASDEASLVAGAGGSAGTCVVVNGDITVKQAVIVKPGVFVVAAKGKRVAITGTATGEGLVVLGEGSGLQGVDVVNAPINAIAVRAASAKLIDVKVTGAKGAAVAVRGEGTGEVLLDGVTLEKSNLGLWASGANVRLKGGRIAEHGGSSLTGGMGVVAVNAAKVAIEGTKIEKNQGTGVLVDGSTVTLKNASVNENAERGVWVQRVTGTIDAPAIRIEDSEISKNRIVGVGAIESRGIIIVGGRIGDTQSAPVPTNLAQTEQIGDGVGIYGGSTDFKIENTAIENNARAAGIIDGSDRGIIIVGGKVGPSGTGLKFVVQNTKGTDVQIPETDKSVPEKALGISAPKLTAPPVL